MVRHRASDAPVGTVQATVSATGDVLQAELAWVVATGHQRRGYAAEAAAGMAGWLRVALRGVHRRPPAQLDRQLYLRTTMRQLHPADALLRRRS